MSGYDPLPVVLVELGIGQQKLTDIDIDMVYDFPILGTDISADTDMA